MSSTSVVLLGASGQLGLTLQKYWQHKSLNPDFRVHAFDREKLDITSPQAVRAVLHGLKPGWIVNCAAYTQVDRAESEQNLAFDINGRGAENIARFAAETGSRLLYVSTDFVFSGNASHPYQPNATPDPLSVYGASKLQGEQAVKGVMGDRALILRTGWVYSPYGHNFLLTMLKLMKEKQQLGVVADQVGTPTATASLAMLIARIVNTDSGGVFHWSDAGLASWYDFAVAIQEEALALKLLDREIPIMPITTAAYPTAARRPAYSVLDTSASCAAFQCQPLHWRKQLRLVLQDISAAR
ncbi:MAG: dTDP-4-dehydrorhamnose reductase [Pseudohongiellaceae bacterium]